MNRLLPRLRGLLLLGALGACRADPCAELSCAAPLRCDPQLGACVSPCAALRCPAGDVCDEKSGQCREDVPPAPVLREVIDRAGRPLVNVALTNAFDLLQPAGAEAAEAGDVTRDRYNADGDPAGWRQRWTLALASQLAIYDALDGTCGNSLAADNLAPRYTALAAILADDQLYLDEGAGACKDGYLAVEGRALGLSLADCGGRTLGADAVDVTYSVLTTGKLSGVGDGVAAGAGAVSQFPFLANPED